ncbi:WASH complex subunit 2-like isoform X2 [Mya arenaria]|uniref:WASH complex subunit 2-like isoform X2 n=1 Tax=Mya arenaria TaxID=6604 RepID=UPI0022E14D34|nr:WASH complex subunit 2-like isoform X2 [Mya arenaria]
MADVPPPPDTNIGNENSAPNALADRSWERAWSLKEMRENAASWSLAGDAGLLQYLQDFSQKLVSRTHEIEKEVESLVHDSKMTTVRVNNVFNDFMMLANTQFVENRVYDEDESEQAETAATEEKKPDNHANTEKTREQREAELIPKVSEAIRLGVDVIEQAFEKLDTNIDDNSDSEDEDESYHVDPILEAKDPYLERSLPYLIGTPQFLNDDNVGLREISDDEESDAGEISESEESEAEETKPAAGGKDSEYSYSESDSETEKKPPKKQKAPFAPQSSEDSDSEGSLFGTSKPAARAEESSEEEEEQSEDESDTEKPQAPPAAPTDFASELARKLGGAPPKPPSPTLGGMESGEEEQPREVRKKKKEKKKKEEKEKPKEDDLFGGGDDSEGDDIFGAGGTFGGKKTSNLFDSDEEDMFGESKRGRKDTEKSVVSEEEEEPVEPAEVKQRSRTRTTSTGKKLPAGAVPMFGGAPKPQAAGGLFDDDNDEDDLFGSTKPVAPEPKQDKKPPSKPSVGGGLFDDEEEDEDDMFATVGKTAETKSEPEKMAEPVKAPPEKRHPAGSVPMFGPPGAGNPLAAALKKKMQQHESEEEDNDDWSDGEKSHSDSIKSNQSGASKQSTKIPSVQSKDSLFVDDPDDSMAYLKPKSNSVSRNTKVTKSLFDEDEEDDLFGSLTTKPATKPAAKSSTKETSVKPKPLGGGLFDDDEDDNNDIFSITSPAKPKTEEKKKPPAGAVSIFPTEIAGTKKEPEPTKTPVKQAATGRPPSKSISMFEGDESDDEMFADKPKPPPLTQSGGAKKSIFDDGGGLFGEEEGEDIFGKPPSTTQAKKSGPTTGKTAVAKETKSAGLFDSDSEEKDIFGPPKVTKQPQKVVVAGATETESTDTIDGGEKEAPIKKPPVGGVAMFGGAGLPGLGKPKSVKTSDVVVKKPQPKKATADPLFGADDDDDEGDLFREPVKKPLSKKAEPVKPAEEVEDSHKQEVTPEPSRASKPVGGVSMFGRMNPFEPPSAAKDRPPSPTPDVDSKSEEVDPLFSEKAASLNFNPSAMMPGAAPPQKEPEPLNIGFDQPAEIRTLQSANKDRAKIGAKRRPPSRQARKSAALSNDQLSPGGSASPLSSPTSLPTSPRTQDNDLDFDPSRVPPPLSDSPERVPSPDFGTGTSTDLFGNEDLFGTGGLGAKSSKSTPRDTSILSSGANDDDLFSGKSIDFPKSKRKTDDLDDLFTKPVHDTPSNRTTSNDDDLFSAVPKTSSAKEEIKTSVKDIESGTKPKAGVSADDDDDDIFAIKKSKPKAKPSPIIEDDDDDIFASSSVNKPKSAETKSGEKMANGQPAAKKDAKTSEKTAMEDDDDLFAAAVKTDKKKTKKAMTKDEDLFADDTDIFSNIPKAKPKEKKTKKKKDLAAPKKTIFKDDIDDIFADASPASKPKEKKKKSVKSKEPTTTVTDDPLS